MAGSDIGVVREHDTALFAPDVGLVIHERVVPAGFSVLADDHQASIGLGFRGGMRWGMTRRRPIGRCSGVFRSGAQAPTAELAERHQRRVRAATARTVQRGRGWTRAELSGGLWGWRLPRRLGR